MISSITYQKILIYLEEKLIKLIGNSNLQELQFFKKIEINFGQTY